MENTMPRDFWNYKINPITGFKTKQYMEYNPKKYKEYYQNKKELLK